MNNPNDANAIYTGGGIWLFYGSCREENRFYMLSSEGFVLIVDKDPGKTFEMDDPSEEEDCLMLEWQQEHQIEELHGEERLAFSLQAMDILESYLSDPDSKEKLGGIFKNEIEAHRKSFKLLEKDEDAATIADVKSAVSSLAAEFLRCSEILCAYDEDVVNEIICKDYPFDKSFDEMAAEVEKWAENIKAKGEI